MKGTSLDDKVRKVRERLADSHKVVALTGAGVSAESGVPTFRGKDGLWRQYRAMDLATPEAFERDPKLVWEFYNWRRGLLGSVRPNAGHLALVDLERKAKEFTLVTQNIDGLHQMAGSRNIIELHGNIWHVRCSGCGQVQRDERIPLPDLPVCPLCRSLLRPHVVWFGEMLDEQILQSAFEAILSSQIMFVIGASGTVEPAASMGGYAKRRGAFVVEINLEPTPYSEVFDLSILGKSGDILPKLSMP